MKRHAVFFSLAAVSMLALAAVSVASGWPGPGSGPGVTIQSVSGNGMVTFAPDRLTRSQLAAVTPTSDTVTLNGNSTTESGPLLGTLLTNAGLTYNSSCKNDELRYWISVSGPQGSVVLTAGEIDANFGQNEAILSLDENGTPLSSPRLILPKDLTGARDIGDVTSVTVGRAAPQLAGGSGSASQACTPTGFQAPVATPAKGTVVVNGDVEHPMSLNYTQLGGLPQVSQTDTYQTSKSNTVSEAGPSLYDIVSMAEPEFQFCGDNDDLNFYVEITSSEDGYTTLVSWAEIDPAYNAQTAALSPLLSLTENNVSTLSTDTDPRFTAPRDNLGGRYVYGAAVITVLRAPGAFPNQRGCGPSFPVGP